VSGIWPLFFTALKKSTTRKDIQRQETRAILCRSTDAGGAPKLRIMHFNLRVRVALLAGFMVLATSSGAFASGQQVWAIDLQARGYDSRTNVRIWFWRHYLVVDPDAEVCRALNKSNLARNSPSHAPPFHIPDARGTHNMLVFDIDTHQEVSSGVLVGADRAAACPQVQGWWWFGESREEVLAAWKDRLVRKDKQGGLYVSREGRPDSLFCRACADDGVRWVAPDLLIVGKYNSEKALSVEVVDLDGKTRYRLDPDKVRAFNAVFNATGTRFALFGTYQSGLGHLLYWLHDRVSDDPFITTDRKTIQVFSTSDGQQLFDKTWRKDEADGDNNWEPDLKLALSDDGAFLAYYTHEAKVLVYRLTSDAAH
jgi:hypothetical protein